LTSQDPAEGYALYCALQKQHLAPSQWRTVPRLGHAIPNTSFNGNSVGASRLLRAYLELSAKICGPPAIDREFRTIGFLTLLDLDGLPALLKKRLLGQPS
jgi:putative hemolysin